MLGLNTSPRWVPPVAAGSITLGAPTGNFFGFETYRGSFYIVRFMTFDAKTLPSGWSSAPAISFEDSVYNFAQVRCGGFSVDWNGLDSTMAFVGVPIWLGFVILALPTLARYRRDRLLRNRGLCPNCRCDIRATPTQCPECGTSLKQA